MSTGSWLISRAHPVFESYSRLMVCQWIGHMMLLSRLLMDSFGQIQQDLRWVYSAPSPVWADLSRFRIVLCFAASSSRSVLLLRSSSDKTCMTPHLLSSVTHTRVCLEVRTGPPTHLRLWFQNLPLTWKPTCLYFCFFITISISIFFFGHVYMLYFKNFLTFFLSNIIIKYITDILKPGMILEPFNISFTLFNAQYWRDNIKNRNCGLIKNKPNQMIINWGKLQSKCVLVGGSLWL